MVTHSMQQAANLGDRLIMMHRGSIVHDLRGAEKRRLAPKICSRASKTCGAPIN
jgi:putative ABC transport system ATP-binding protein